MEILKILKESAEELIPEDLDFFETELATNETYSASYQEECRKMIKELRTWKFCGTSLSDKDDEKKEKEEEPEEQTHSKHLVMGIMDVAPEEVNTAFPDLTPAQKIQSDVNVLRQQTDYKSAFKKYVKESQIINSDFLDKHFAIFDSWEIDAIVSVKQLGEDFLEKYFGAISTDKIARYQLFSENFFMKHFNQFDSKIVLEHGKNEWRRKENRSKQLDVFLRLKGVKN